MIYGGGKKGRRKVEGQNCEGWLCGRMWGEMMRRERLSGVGESLRDCW